MDRDTLGVTIRTFKQRTPFQPFTLALENGDRLEVDHTEAVIYREGTGMFLGPGGVPVIFDHEGVTEVIGDLSGRASSEQG